MSPASPELWADYFTAEPQRWKKKMDSRYTKFYVRGEDKNVLRMITSALA